MEKTIKKIIDLFFGQITELGGFFFYSVVLIACLVLNKINLFAKLFLSLIIIMVLSIAIKWFYFKERPKKQKKINLFERLDASRFPSVHSMRAFSLAFWFSVFFNNLLFTIYLSIMALTVMYSRTYLKKHYFIDIFGGLFFSAIINILIWCCL